jgi:hypothetical protein
MQQSFSDSVTARRRRVKRHHRVGESKTGTRKTHRHSLLTTTARRRPAAPPFSRVARGSFRARASRYRPSRRRGSSSLCGGGRLRSALAVPRSLPGPWAAWSLLQSAARHPEPAVSTRGSRGGELWSAQGGALSSIHGGRHTPRAPRGPPTGLREPASARAQARLVRSGPTNDDHVRRSCTQPCTEQPHT